MCELDRLICLVKSRHYFCIPVANALALIRLLNKLDYDEYYYIRSNADENGYDGNVYLKLKDKYKLFAFRILIHFPTNYASISYDYGVNDVVDRILLKWLTDLLGDCKYLKEDLKKYEEKD